MTPLGRVALALGVWVMIALPGGILGVAGVNGVRGSAPVPTIITLVLLPLLMLPRVARGGRSPFPFFFACLVSAVLALTATAVFKRRHKAATSTPAALDAAPRAGSSAG